MEFVVESFYLKFCEYRMPKKSSCNSGAVRSCMDGA